MVGIGKLDEGAIPEAIQSTTLGLLRDQYGTIARQEANLTAELGPRHPRVIEGRAQLARAQQQISEEIARIADASRTAASPVRTATTRSPRRVNSAASVSRNARSSSARRSVACPFCTPRTQPQNHQCAMRDL